MIVNDLRLGKRGAAWHRGSILASHPAAQGSVPSIPKIFQRPNFDVAEVNQWHWLEESGQWLGKVDQTHLEPASGKLVLKKDLASGFILSAQSQQLDLPRE